MFYFAINHVSGEIKIVTNSHTSKMTMQSNNNFLLGQKVVHKNHFMDFNNIYSWKKNDFDNLYYCTPT